MTDIPFGPLVAYDPTTGALVADARGSVYAITDTAFAAPLSVVDLSGVAMTEVASSAIGILDEFVVANAGPQDVEVNWKSGSYIIRLTSFKGVMAFAQQALDQAAQATQTAADSTTAAQAAQAAAEAAQQATGGAGGGGAGIVTDPLPATRPVPDTTPLIIKSNTEPTWMKDIDVRLGALT